MAGCPMFAGAKSQTSRANVGHNERRRRRHSNLQNIPTNTNEPWSYHKA
jgi:hypothetical protein